MVLGKRAANTTADRQQYTNTSKVCDDTMSMLPTIDIVSSQLYVCHILVSKKCQLQAGTIHPRPLA